MVKLSDVLKYVLIGTLVAAVFYKCTTGCKKVESNPSGTVISHVVTADKNGRRIFSTIIKLDDGSIVEKTGLRFYAIKEGDRVSYTETDYKFEW